MPGIPKVRVSHILRTKKLFLIVGDLFRNYTLAVTEAQIHLEGLRLWSACFTSSGGGPTSRTTRATGTLLHESSSETERRRSHEMQHRRRNRAAESGCGVRIENAKRLKTLDPSVRTMRFILLFYTWQWSLQIGTKCGRLLLAQTFVTAPVLCSPLRRH